MAFEITYWQLFAVISVLWICTRVITGLKEKRFSPARELQMLLVFVCIVVIVRFVDFPLHRVNGEIAPLKFDSSRIIPPWINLVPVVHLFDIYDGWQINILGNIAMFIPVGIVWPFCFRKLDTFGKTLLAGFGFTLFIELTQLLIYERCSDIDDLILNTAGVAIGALIFFGCRRSFGKGRKIKN